MKKVRIILSAFNIHGGGGFVLLSALFKNNNIQKFILDSRIKNRIKKNKKYFFIKKKIFDRLIYFHSNIKNKNASHLICFNNLPPIIKPKLKVILFIQTFYFFANILNYKFNLYTTLRIYFEKIWFRLGIANVDEIWIQTPTMKKRLKKHLKKLNLENRIIVKIMPLTDQKLLNILKSKKKIGHKSINRNNFFYPADSAGHKNHERLISAFSKINKPFKLFLTIDNDSFEKYMMNIDYKDQKKFINLNTLPRDEVLSLFKNKIGALIFPSLDESFGIPLIEACLYKKNILVSNKNYAHDLIQNAIYFNPESINSIKNSITKYLNNLNNSKPKLKKHINFLTAKQFINGIN
jgi:hypothetical protein